MRALEAGKKGADVGVILAEWNEFRPRPPTRQEPFGLRLLEHKKAVALAARSVHLAAAFISLRGPTRTRRG